MGFYNPAAAAAPSPPRKKTRARLIFFFFFSYLHRSLLVSHLIFDLNMSKYTFYKFSTENTKTGSIASRNQCAQIPKCIQRKLQQRKSQRKKITEKDISNFYRLKGQSLHSKRPLIQLIQAIRLFGCSVAKFIENSMPLYLLVCVCGKCLHNSMFIWRRMAVPEVAQTGSCNTILLWHVT